MSKSSTNSLPDADEADAYRLHDTVSNLIHRARQCTDDAFVSEIGLDLTPRQLVVLEAIATNPGASQTRLCEATGIDRSTIADIMSRLVQKRVVARRRSRQDARAYVIELTEAGQDMLLRSYPVAAKIERRITEILGARRRDELCDMLEMIVHELRR